MARKKSRSGGLPNGIVLLIVGAALALLIGEAWFQLRSERGQTWLARFGIGEPERIVLLVGRSIHRGLDAAGIPRDSITQAPADTGASVRWRIGLPPGGSTLQANYAVTEALRAAGATVFSGRETYGANRELLLRLRVGIGARPTHDLVFVRPRPPEPTAGGPDPESGRVALVLYGFGEELEAAKQAFALPVSFAVAIVPGAKASGELFRAARERSREIVLHLPLEPLNYPRINPGPGTITVTMGASQIGGKVKRYVEQAGQPVAVANHMGSLATQDMEVMSAVYRELRRARLPFLHVNPAPGAVCKSLASDLGIAYDEPDAVLDSETQAKDAKALDKRWSDVLDLARTRGSITVWVRSTPLTAEWLPKAAAQKRLGGVSLVPLSAVVRRQIGN